ncbi:MAG: phosphatidylserine decarboxylase family protein [Verrucomicrobia bacterium]|nr:MAG: phosphatidylserine decarboxylase family protein [Verrucomicrobiota bacterium]
MRIVKDGWPLIIGLLLAGVGVGAVGQALGCRVTMITGYGAGVVLCAFMVYFFRDPERTARGDDSLLMAGADGLVRNVEVLREEKYLETDAVRISIFLNPFNVHVNRSPMGGTVTALAYVPGAHLGTYLNSASEHNEHSSILIEGNGTKCLVKQIVGPIVRRVVYWLVEQQQIVRGERIGMMKFGSRLDMYFVKADVDVLVKKGDRVRAGETVVAQLKRKGGA